jgi:glyoxylate reductase
MTAHGAGERERPRIVVARDIPESVVERLRTVGDVVLNDIDRELFGAELRDTCAGAAGVLTSGVERIDRAFFDAVGPQLRIVANLGVGYDNVDIGAATARGVIVTNTPDVVTDDTADMALALMLAAARRVGEADRMIRRDGTWVASLGFMLGARVTGATLGIIGFGRIGQAVARRARGFGMRVRYASPRAAPKAVDRELEAAHCSIAELIETADFISLHCPLTEQTRHLIGAAELSRMKSTAILVNTARGGVVDDQALAEALHRGVIAGAGLDVFEREPHVERRLIECESAVLVPHLGSATRDTRMAMCDLAADNVILVLSGQSPRTPVLTARRG